ncbi:hypothetical protein T310_4717 [Rasamsonia emersonii CBS 393.64]|uniref:Uncharacterized protein n=1 Tax=Rasamsonia emersonii (strain ATCC 16479 / CBS 393.64 / IMI 116815) TaxID=1408163 RepID=A0A0F4YTW0_RASE3|nr:hypothetical protein T310_4717 [Rasamsonia emersonii CBS 393.64]KKA21276.1 hypothetical protein T310_4717 [Rasamsonia emersonii CBS 393.64]
MAQVASGQGPVEARSLSSITAIASNPPAYPRNPTQQPLDPLVLYIVRVPGSRDVFLTPLKPPTKSSVSAEAINSSLYYLHVASAEDEAVLRRIELERDQERQEAAARREQPANRLPAAVLSRLNSFRRKPVGGNTEPVPPPPPPHQEGVESTRPASSDSIPQQPVSQPNQTSEYRPYRPDRPEAENAHTEDPIKQPAPGDRPVRSTTELNDNTNRFRIPRRPLTSLPKQTDLSPGVAGGSAQHQNRWSADLGYSHKWPSIASDDTNLRFRSSLDSQRPQAVPNLSSKDPSLREYGVPAADSHRRKTDSARDSSFHITLIRRDPSHGSQWNVGTISGSDADKSAIEIEISTPGYGRFVNNDDPLSLASLGLNLPLASRDGLSSSTSTMPASIPATRAENAPSGTDVGPKKFRRKVLAVSHGHGHRHDDSRQSVDRTNSGVAESHISAKFVPPRSEMQTYDPWTVDECRESGSDRGRTTIQCPISSGHPPHGHHPSPSPSRSPGNDKTKRSSLAQIFTSNLQRVRHARPGSRSGPESPSGRSSFHVRMHSDTSSDDNTPPGADEDRLDLSLAREHAGGGLRGKSAKLGKLIIEDEGIKMLDLVVAACMGVWWRSYYQP